MKRRIGETLGMKARERKRIPILLCSCNTIAVVGLLPLTLLLTLALAVAIPLTIRLILDFVEREQHRTLDFIAHTKRPLQPTIVNPPTIAAHRDPNNAGQVYFEYIKGPDT